MKKSYLPLLVLACAILGFLVWLDNRPNGAVEEPRPLADISGDDQVGEAKASTPAAPASHASNQPNSEASVPANPLLKLDKKRLRDTVARPLFVPGRRPPKVVKAAPPRIVKSKEKPKPVNYKLLGVAKAGERTIALLARESDGRNFRVEVGDMLSGWSVSSITTDSVRLERSDGITSTVNLFKDTATPK